MFAATSFFAVSPALSQEAGQRFKYNNVWYEVVSPAEHTCRTAAATPTAPSGNSEVSGALTLPEKATLDNVRYTVVAIGDKSFEKCTALTSVLLPGTVTSVGNNAFMDCSALESVELPQSVVEIGEFAFNNTAITSVVIPDGVTRIREYTFNRCARLQSVTLPVGLTAIGKYAFGMCSALRSAIVPPNSTAANDAFAYCRNLQRVAYPQDIIDSPVSKHNGTSAPTCVEVKYLSSDIVRDGWIYSADGKTIKFAPVELQGDIVIPSAITSVYPDAFARCKDITTVVMSRNQDYVNSNAFDGCTSLDKIVLLGNLKGVSASAFNGCPASHVCTTVATPPKASSATAFSNYSGTLHVADEAAKAKYGASKPTWYKFANTALLVMPESVEVYPDFIAAMPGEVYELTATFTPADTDLPYLEWTSTNPDVASVDRNGVVTINSQAAYGAPECYIEASSVVDGKVMARVPVAMSRVRTGIEDVSVDDAQAAPAQLYTLQGVPDPENPAPGLYIRRCGNKASKVLVR